VAELVGYNGQVDWAALIDSDQTYQTFSWSLDISADAIDVTDFTSTGWRKQLAGLKGWSGTIEAYIPSDTTYRSVPSDTIGIEAQLHLYLDSSKYLNGKAICTGMHPGSAVDGVQTQTFDFTGSSDLFYV